ncbi:MAG: hypothetical protein MI741_09115, partial [Rhodospirillales bacterium]|nr:hypothetical protein [Rhodospirillales bacterium]
MTLSRFSESFIATHHAIDNTAPSYEDKDFELVIRTLGGTTYEHGLYRVVIASKVASATDAISHVFPETRGRIRVFAYDWLGRHFAIDVKEQPSKRVLMLEPGAGETMEIPVPIIEFHNTELVDYPNDALAKSFYENWRQ